MEFGRQEEEWRFSARRKGGREVDRQEEEWRLSARRRGGREVDRQEGVEGGCACISTLKQVLTSNYS